MPLLCDPRGGGVFIGGAEAPIRHQSSRADRVDIVRGERMRNIADLPGTVVDRSEVAGAPAVVRRRGVAARAIGLLARWEGALFGLMTVVLLVPVWAFTYL